MAILELKGITKYFAGLTALDHVEIEVREGEILGLIGPNGAGKTTLFNVISGIFKPESGRALFQGDDITKTGMEARAKLGIGRTFQIPNLALSLTAFENIEVVARFFRRVSRTDTRQKANKIGSIESLKFVNFEFGKDRKAGELTLFQRKLVEIARALVIDPKLLLLDEPLCGLTPTEVVDAIGIIKKINSIGITICWIEHVMSAIMGGTERIIVLDKGQKIAEGQPKEIQQNEKVIEAYLGRES